MGNKIYSIYCISDDEYTLSGVFETFELALNEARKYRYEWLIKEHNLNKVESAATVWSDRADKGDKFEINYCKNHWSKELQRVYGS